MIVLTCGKCDSFNFELVRSINLFFDLFNFVHRFMWQRIGYFYDFASDYLLLFPKLEEKDKEALLLLEGFCSANTWESFVNIMSSTTMMIVIWILTLLGGSFGIGAYEDWDGLRCVYFAIVSGKRF